LPELGRPMKPSSMVFISQKDVLEAPQTANNETLPSSDYQSSSTWFGGLKSGLEICQQVVRFLQTDREPN